MGLGASRVSERAFSAPATPLWVGDAFAEKRRALRAASPAALAVLSDFDRTLTASGAPECHDIVGLHAGDTMPPAYSAAMARMLDFSQPLPTATLEEWWVRCSELMVEHGWRRACLAPAVAASGVTLRDGAVELVAALAAHEVPLVVLSAGLSDVIETLLRARCGGALPPSVAVVANRMVFDDDDGGKLLRVTPSPPLHTDNKREMLVALRPDAFAPASPRRLVILLGDKPKDAHSLDLLPPGAVDVVLRVGFMEGHDGRYSLEDYAAAYDVVFSADCSMAPVQELLDEVVASGGCF